jgi:hypothetical protein
MKIKGRDEEANQRKSLLNKSNKREDQQKSR